MSREDGWHAGNRVELLENGDEFFPAVFSAIEGARREVLIETFILFEDKVGLALRQVLRQVARRGVTVHLTVDGFGSPALSAGFVQGLIDAGVQVHVFDPPPRLSRRLRPWRRLHRKIVVVDGEVGFVGGINYSADQLDDFGPEAKQDYAVALRGPVVQALWRAARDTVAPAAGAWPPRRWWRRPAPAAAVPAPPGEGSAQAKLVLRDNAGHRDDIERHYRLALHAARHEVIIANAYFFPGWRLLRSLQRAARRGVRVHLILQGRPDIAWAAFAARLVYDRLIEAGVQIHEFCEKPLHGKVAVVDGEWATVGSSNLDPLSLALNLEANVMVRDRDFAQSLKARLLPLIEERCRTVRLEHTPAGRWWWRLGLGALVFHAMRVVPRWAARLPVSEQPLVPVADSGVVTREPALAVEAWQWQSGAATRRRA